MARTSKKPFTGEELCAVGVSAIKSVLKQIIYDSETDPETAFEQVKLGKRNKPALRIDVGAEDSLARTIHRYRGERFKNLHILGEERLENENLDLTGRSGDWVLADAVDGTDLLERGLGNWCSAAVFYRPTNPVGRRIMAAVVGVSNGDVYYSSQDEPTVKVNQKDGTVRTVFGPPNTRQAEHATICFYGQKTNGLNSISKTKMIRDPELINASTVRFHTLAGIPMMLKLIDHRVRDARGIDVVFDLRGQKPHDVVPGAYLCLKAGAHLIDIKDGTTLTLEKLESCLLFPARSDHKLRYVIGATEELAQQMNSLLMPHDLEIAM